MDKRTETDAGYPCLGSIHSSVICTTVSHTDGDCQLVDQRTNDMGGSAGWRSEKKALLAFLQEHCITQ